MYGFIVIEDSYPIQVERLAQAVNLIFGLREVNGSARDYYDEFVDGPTEYGVRMDISGLSPEQAIEQMKSIWQLCVAQYEDQEVRLEISA